MKLTHEELEFLSAWAREEWEPACYQLPCHRMQLSHEVSAGQLVEFIKAWTACEGKRDHDILAVAANTPPQWPWATPESFRARFCEASQWQSHRERLGGDGESSGAEAPFTAGTETRSH